MSQAHYPILHRTLKYCKREISAVFMNIWYNYYDDVSRDNQGRDYAYGFCMLNTGNPFPLSHFSDPLLARGPCPSFKSFLSPVLFSCSNQSCPGYIVLLLQNTLNNCTLTSHNANCRELCQLINQVV